jgi:hypothetical protein
MDAKVADKVVFAFKMGARNESDAWCSPLEGVAQVMGHNG